MNVSVMCQIALLLFLMSSADLLSLAHGEELATIELSAEELRDKCRGGLLGQLLGNLNGLEHEMKYIDDPGNVSSYTPSLPAGARTDDDTDFEWVYLYEMQQQDEVVLSPERIAELWTSRINRRIWCSNQYARQLMDLGLKPPLTGCFALNPWADFNISGQFLCESFGLIAPAMPQTASRIALNYTTVAIDLEPAQTTQLFASMIATAFVEEDIKCILESGLAAVDRRSRLHEIIGDIRQWHRQFPDDWKSTRRMLMRKYSQVQGEMRDRNGYELNTGSTIAALLYGEGDFVKTLITAFNFGWDADNTAATAGTIIGVTKGYRWMLSQGWQIVDRYENTTRENMPYDETITSFADRLVDLAEHVISKNGGGREIVRGRMMYRIPIESAQCVLALPEVDEQFLELQRMLAESTRHGIIAGKSSRQRARSAYIAICLGTAQELRQEYPDEWNEAIIALAKYQNVVQAIFYHANVPAGDMLRRRADNAGLEKPARREPLW